jgi:hypothetical protein
MKTNVGFHHQPFMLPLFWLLVARISADAALPPPSSLIDITGEIYTTRQIVAASITFRDCAFRDCSRTTIRILTAMAVPFTR